MFGAKVSARFKKLSWLLLEHKCRYYMFDSPTISDTAYDLLEKEYEALALELGLEPYSSNMVGFDMERPSCKRVFERVQAQQIQRQR